MRKTFVVFLFVLFHSVMAYPAEVPSWVYNSATKQGETWQFSGSVHDISLMNIAVPLARSAALSNLASYIGINVNSAVGQAVEGSEVDGYTESIQVSQGYLLDNVAAYGVTQKEVFVERMTDASGKQRFNVHVLLEVSDADLQKAKADFSKRGYRPRPLMKPKKDEGIIKSLIRKIAL